MKSGFRILHSQHHMHYGYEKIDYENGEQENPPITYRHSPPLSATHFKTWICNNWIKIRWTAEDKTELLFGVYTYRPEPEPYSIHKMCEKTNVIKTQLKFAYVTNFRQCMNLRGIHWMNNSLYCVRLTAVVSNMLRLNL